MVNNRLADKLESMYLHSYAKTKVNNKDLSSLIRVFELINNHEGVILNVRWTYDYFIIEAIFLTSDQRDDFEEKVKMFEAKPQKPKTINEVFRSTYI